jgi:hypothetical protein
MTEAGKIKEETGKLYYFTKVVKGQTQTLELWETLRTPKACWKRAESL